MGKYFTIAELVRSNVAAKQGINNILPKALLPNAQRLIKQVLDPLREAYGKPITVTSGYRCERLNVAVKGSSTSKHKLALAADIVGTPNTVDENRKLFALAQSCGIDFDQLIDEKQGTWIHIGLAEGKKNRHQILKLQ